MRANTAQIASTATEDSEREVYSKVTWRLLPFLFVCYIFAFLDRVNIGFAALQMKQDLNFSDAAYGLGAGLFFVGYFLFEVPSNLLLVKIGAKKTLARIMICWGLISAGFALVQTPPQFYIARFLLGAFEAGFFPGIVLYLTYWYPTARRGRVIGAFMAAIPVAGVIGGPLSGWIMSSMHGHTGWYGWQWMFLIEGIPSVILGLLVLVVLTNRPAEAKWLDSREKKLIEMNIDASMQGAHNEHSFRKALKDPKIYVLGLVYCGLAIGFYAMSFWMPTLIRSYGVGDPFHIGLLTTIPNIVAIITMIAVSRSSDRTMERRWHTAMCLIIGCVGLFATTMVSGNLVLAMIAITVAQACMAATMPVFWTIPTTCLSGSAAAGGIAMINSIGLVGGFASPTIIGWVKTATGSLTSGLYLASASLLAGAILLLIGIPAQVLKQTSSAVRN